MGNFLFGLDNRVNGINLQIPARPGGEGEIAIRVPEPHMGRIEDAHLVVCHMISYYFMEQG